MHVAVPVHIIGLMRTLLVLMRHASPYRRAAAATTFNHCYRAFREEDSACHRTPPPAPLPCPTC